MGCPLLRSLSSSSGAHGTEKHRVTLLQALEVVTHKHERVELGGTPPAPKRATFCSEWDYSGTTI